jgi:hypothetical protein
MLVKISDKNSTRQTFIPNEKSYELLVGKQLIDYSWST